MMIINAPAEMTAWANDEIRAGRTIALVPTMGFFHEGHLALMRRAKKEADRVVVSLFVNPIQFGPDEDYGRYPRDLERDAGLADREGVAVLFTPSAGEMYPEDARTRVSVSGLTDILCGRSRPGHFDGVCTVVAKLVNIVKPQKAVFGEKDFQQLAIIRRMVADLNWDLTIIGHPIVREPDGLAMSSRNVYLSPEERKAAVGLSDAIVFARDQVRAGETRVARLVEKIEARLRARPLVETEYVAVVDAATLEPRTEPGPGCRLVLAAKVGRTRLIDNGPLC